MKIGSVEAARGRITRGTLFLGEYPDGSDILAPMIVARGGEDGSVLWVQCCVHGSEVVGPLAVQRFLTQLQLSEVKGAIVFLLATNPLAYRGLHRLTPHDGGNLNNTFPGDALGTLTEQMAARSFELALSIADAAIDLHSGGDQLVCCHHVLYYDDGSRTGRASRQLAKHLSVSRLCNIPVDQFTRSALRCFVDSGVPAVLVESGGGARVTTEDIGNHVRAVEGACLHLGILGGPRPDAADHPAGNRVHMMRATRGGIFHATAAPGADVNHGDEIGRTLDLFGDVVEVHKCPIERAWVAAIRRPYMPIYSGDDVAELVQRS